MSEQIGELVDQVEHGLRHGEGLGDELQDIRAAYDEEVSNAVEAALGGNI